jgi:DNA-binding response OmpR family regulator
MAIRTRVLVADTDLDALSKIYLSLLHRNYKAEICTNAEDLPQKIKKFKPSVLIIDCSMYLSLERKLKLPVIVLLESNEYAMIKEVEDIRLLRKPLQSVTLIGIVQQLTV